MGNKHEQIGWGSERICSECGKKFYIERPSIYTYQLGHDFQCSYVCYDHACLRRDSHKAYLIRDKLIKQINSCEETMVHQGKVVLNPIILIEDRKSKKKK